MLFKGEQESSSKNIEASFLDFATLCDAAVGVESDYAMRFFRKALNIRLEYLEDEKDAFLQTVLAEIHLHHKNSEP